TARKVLAFDPENLQATANLTRFLFLSGEREEAALLAAKLKAMPAKDLDMWVKKAETFSYLGDDAAVLEAFQGAEKAELLDPAFTNPLLYHLAAAASYHLGNQAQAKKYWQEALKLSPGFDLAVENLQDLRSSVGERHGVWAFSM